jgi:hypothetical protein
MSNSKSSTPDKIYAKCPICGSGGDIPASRLTPADAQSNIDITATGDYLEWFQGLLMCPLCKQNRINRQSSEVSAERHAEEQMFRDRAGFRRSIS